MRHSPSRSVCLSVCAIYVSVPITQDEKIVGSSRLVNLHGIAHAKRNSGDKNKDKGQKSRSTDHINRLNNSSLMKSGFLLDTELWVG